MRYLHILPFLLPFLAHAQADISGELKTWHKITLTVDGPETSEDKEYNPFLHYRMDVTFTHDSISYTVPGYFAADGNAAETGATKGNKWRAHLSADFPGQWTYRVSFLRGSNVAVKQQGDLAGTRVQGTDGLRGSFTVAKTDKSGRDLRGKGRLLFQGRRYPQWAETGEHFFKSGTDAPENLLSYADFDGTFHDDGHQDERVKTWAPHVADWQAGDPSWRGGKGKGLIGAVNYLSGKGMNSISFLTNNIAGDDQNVFPYVNYENYERIDVSKMAQWEIIFAHATSKGMFLHFKTTEVENQGLLDGGDLGTQRQLYHRELVARFGHHPALNWNVGEENGVWRSGETTPFQTTDQRLAMAQSFYDLDPYHHHLVVHNGQPFFDVMGPQSKYSGISLQSNKPDFSNVYPFIRKWDRAFREAGLTWAIAIDEPGDARHSLLPDAENPEHDNARQNALWGSYLAGAWGQEWYFGYNHAHSDLTCEDFRSRDLFWDQCRYSLNFLHDNNVPLWDMEPDNDLTTDPNDWVIAKPGEVYLILRKMGAKSSSSLTVAEGNYTVRYFNPRTGKFAGDSVTPKTVKTITLPAPPSETEMDWIVLVERG